MISIRSTWWHRLVRVIQSFAIIGLCIAVFMSGLPETRDRTHSERVWYVSGNEGYSDKLDSEVFDCARYWKNEKNPFDANSPVLPVRVIQECERVADILLSDQALVAGFLPADFDRSDLRLVRAMLISASDCDVLACLGFNKGITIHQPPYSAYELLLLKEKTSVEFPKWFSTLNASQRKLLINFNSVTAKYEDTQRIEHSTLAWYFVLFIACLIGLLAYIVTEILYRIVLFVIFGKLSFRLKLE